jgi:F420-dependent methylenetetrahydromethanopterin dehydrogenase
LDQYGYATDVPLIMRREYLDTAPLATFKRNIIEDLAIDGSWKSITLYEDDDRVIESVNGLGTVKGCRVRAVHCTWAKKPRRMMSKGVA